jgi:hypothetical protein
MTDAPLLEPNNLEDSINLATTRIKLMEEYKAIIVAKSSLVPENPNLGVGPSCFA